MTTAHPFSLTQKGSLLKWYPETCKRAEREIWFTRAFNMKVLLILYMSSPGKFPTSMHVEII